MKLMNNIALSVMGLLIGTLTLFSCEGEDSAEVNQDRIYTDYELFYDADEDITRAIARFRLGSRVGTVLQLNNPALVTFDGEELTYNATFLGHVKRFAGRKTGGTFVYTNVDGKKFTNQVPQHESIAFPDNLTEISKSSAFSMRWKGEPLGRNERVGVFIGSWAWGDDALFVEFDNGANSILMGQNQLDNLPEGTSRLHMDRFTELDVEEGTDVGGRIRGKYQAEPITVTITE